MTDHPPLRSSGYIITEGAVKPTTTEIVTPKHLFVYKSKAIIKRTTAMQSIKNEI
jgi:hypothetical protein